MDPRARSSGHWDLGKEKNKEKELNENKKEEQTSRAEMALHNGARLEAFRTSDHCFRGSQILPLWMRQDVRAQTVSIPKQSAVASLFSPTYHNYSPLFIVQFERWVVPTLKKRELFFFFFFGLFVLIADDPDPWFNRSSSPLLTNWRRAEEPEERKKYHGGDQKEQERFSPK